MAGGGAALVLLLSSCSASVPAAGSDAFAGLDPSVVAEVMENSTAWGKVLQEDGETRASMAQGIVRNFLQCRSAYEAYRSWVTTGATPPVPEQPAATHPLEPADTAILQSQAYVEDAIESGDPARLRGFLVCEARCGEWIAVEAGDADGPTIADSVHALATREAELARATASDPSVVDAAGVLAEFWEASTGYELPEGAAFVAPDVPAQEPLPSGTLAPSRYEVGLGRTIVVGQWTCAWQRHWLDVRSSDPAAGDAALSELTKLVDDPTFRTLYAASAQDHARTQLEQARLGDPSSIANDVSVNCPA